MLPLIVSPFIFFPCSGLLAFTEINKQQNMMMNDVRGYSVIGGDGLSMLASGTKPGHHQEFYYGNSPALAYMGNPYYQKAPYPEVRLAHPQQAMYAVHFLMLFPSSREMQAAPAPTVEVLPTPHPYPYLGSSIENRAFNVAGPWNKPMESAPPLCVPTDRLSR